MTNTRTGTSRTISFSNSSHAHITEQCMAVKQQQHASCNTHPIWAVKGFINLIRKFVRYLDLVFQCCSWCWLTAGERSLGQTKMHHISVLLSLHMVNMMPNETSAALAHSSYSKLWQIWRLLETCWQNLGYTNNNLLLLQPMRWSLWSM